MFQRAWNWLTGKVSRFSITAQVTDSNVGWSRLSGGGPADRPWWEKQQEFADALDAWIHNAWVRQVVTLTRAYVVGDSLTISAKEPDLAEFLTAFIEHPENNLVSRLGP